MDLAIKPKQGMDVPATVGSEPYYPCLSLRDDQVDEFREEAGKVEIGSTVTAVVKLKVTGLRADKFGKCIDFDVTELEPGAHGDESKHKSSYGGFSKMLMHAMSEES